MHKKYANFVEVWQSAPSIEAAAAALGMKVRSVTRQANRLKVMGIPLRSLTDPRFNAHKKERKEGPLTNDERAFMVEHYDFAQRVAWKKCRSIDLPPHLQEDIAEGAAVEGLLLTARRSIQPGFVHQTAKGLVVKAVRSQVWAQMKKLLSPVRASPDIVEIAPDRSSGPLQEAIAREEQPRVNCENDAARKLIVSLPDTSKRKEAKTKKELLSLQMKARELGLATTGTTDELRERLAAHYRSKLVVPDLVHEHHEQGAQHEQPVEQERVPSRLSEIPECIRQRLASPQTKSREQRAAEKFVVAWQLSSTAQEAARKLNKSVKAVTSFAGRLRHMGVTSLKELPTSPGPLIRGVRALIPSVN